MEPLAVSLWMAIETSRLITGATGVHCTFLTEDQGHTINVQVLPRNAVSSDPRDIYLKLNEKIHVRGVVRPTAEHGGSAVLMQGISARHVTYTIGLHQSGMAVLEIRMPDDVRRLREGTCNGHQGKMQRWTEQ